MKKLLHIIIGALIFVALGNGFVSTATMMIPTKFWYQIESPVDVMAYENKVVLQANRKSRIEVDGEAVIEIVIAEVDEVERDVSFHKVILIERGESLMQEKLILKTNLEPGIYVVKGIVKFELNGISKREHFYSEKFKIPQE